MEVKPGDVIKPAEGQVRALEDLVDSVHDAKIAFKLAAEWMKKANLRLFGAIHELYPALVDFDLSVDHSTMEIVVLARREPLEALEFARLYRRAKKEGWLDTSSPGQ